MVTPKKALEKLQSTLDMVSNDKKLKGTVLSILVGAIVTLSGVVITLIKSSPDEKAGCLPEQANENTSDSQTDNSEKGGDMESSDNNEEQNDNPNKS